jgi:hypothetical protein
MQCRSTTAPFMKASIVQSCVTTLGKMVDLSSNVKPDLGWEEGIRLGRPSQQSMLCKPGHTRLQGEKQRAEANRH